MNVFQKLLIYFVQSIKTRQALIEKNAVLEEALDAYRKVFAVLLAELRKRMAPEEWEQVEKEMPK